MPKMISKKDEKLLRKLLAMAVEPDEALTYDEMCGFLFGVAMTPEMIAPSEWLPMVFGPEMVNVDSEKEAQQFFGGLIRVVNGLTSSFQNGKLRFPFDVKDFAAEDGLEKIQDWTYGLCEALLLRPYLWEPDVPEEELDEAQKELLTSLAIIQGVAAPDEAGELFNTEFDETEGRDERLLASLFAMLPVAVESLLGHAAIREEEWRERVRSRRTGPMQVKHEEPKVGRNDPCPCGSGKKYKKCCLVGQKIVPIH